MAIYCTQDGTEHPDNATYCMKCGQPLASEAPSVSHAQLDTEREIASFTATDNERIIVTNKRIQFFGRDGSQSQIPLNDLTSVKTLNPFLGKAEIHIGVSGSASYWWRRFDTKQERDAMLQTVQQVMSRRP